MGITQSKDETNAIVRNAVKGRDILDDEGIRLREQVDKCLSANMWYFTGAGVLLSIPACFYYKTQKPLLAAAILTPLLDMGYATSKCSNERDAFLSHYTMLRQKWIESMSEEDPDSKPLPPSEEVKIGDLPPSTTRSTGRSTWSSQPTPDASRSKSRPVSKDSEWSEKEPAAVSVEEGIVFEDLPSSPPPKKKGWW